MGAILAATLMKKPDAILKTKIWQIQYDIPLPIVHHAILSEKDIGDREVVVFGDVHGCLDELKILINQQQLTPSNTLFIFCGDIVNKGPKNHASLQFVRSLDALVVRGNHEERVIKEALDWRRCPDTYRIPPKLAWVKSVTDEELDYLMQLPYTISIPSLQAIIVHAGLLPWVPLELQQPKTMTLIRNIADYDLLEAKDNERLEGIHWPSVWRGPSHVYYGHDARRGLQQYSHATGLDTGAVYGNFLTAKSLNGSMGLVSVKSNAKYEKTNPNTL